MHLRTLAFALISPLLIGHACDEDDNGNVDEDGDGWTIGEGDCDDTDPDTYPGAPEDSETDAKDQNCDGPGE